ncbi:hypothetical protein ACS0TY_006604 [Phlomoides rotata]
MIVLVGCYRRLNREATMAYLSERLQTGTVGVIGNLVHSSPDIKKEVLAVRALHSVIGLLRLLWKGIWFVQEKSCKILSLIVSGRLKSQVSAIASGESISKKEITTINDVLKGLLKNPSHPCRDIPTTVNSLATLLKEQVVQSSFVQLLYETCLCIWHLSFYEPSIEYLASSRSLPRLIEVVKGSTKEKMPSHFYYVSFDNGFTSGASSMGISFKPKQSSDNLVVILILRNLLHKGSFGAQMVDLGMSQLVQSLKAHAWSDEDLLEDLSRLEEGLKENVKQLSSFDKYKQEVLLRHLDWSPMHKDPIFWRENITCFEEHDFQIILVKIVHWREVTSGGVGIVFFRPMKPHRLCMTHHLVLSYELPNKTEIDVLKPQPGNEREKNDRRYGALRSLGERKQTFNEFVDLKKKHEAEEKHSMQKKEEYGTMRNKHNIEHPKTIETK